MLFQKTVVIVNDKIQQNYRYILTEPIGQNFPPYFRPQLTPKQMLELGVFGGKYMTDCQNEFPQAWFINAKLSPKKSDPQINFFKVEASQPLSVWKNKGWIFQDDPRGWFQWYCRYYIGRRIPEEDKRQIKRWMLMKRHMDMNPKNCTTA